MSPSTAPLVFLKMTHQTAGDLYSISGADELIGMTMDTIPTALEDLNLQWISPSVVRIMPTISPGHNTWDIYHGDKDGKFLSPLSEAERAEFEQAIRKWLKEWREAKTKQIWPSTHPLVLEQYPIGEVPKKIQVGGLEVPIPPPRGAEVKAQIDRFMPRTLSMEEYERDWKPKGWQLIIIGPTSTWRQEWGEWEAIRDIVQNCLDEAEAYQWGYDEEGLWISDKGRGVAVADFLLGPPKLKPDWARGKFGEGMKIATLALIRKGWPVRVETTGRELWLIFLEQKVNGTAETLAALWRPNGSTKGTTFHIIGYTGGAFEDRFAVNIPKKSILWEGPSTIKRPKQRFNQLIDYAFPTGSRIFTRDIYFRDINSPYSYNLWSFDMAPDRHAPAKEDDVWIDMGRLWCTVTKIDLLEIFLQMVKDPPLLEAEESYKLSMDSWAMGEVVPGKYYADLIKDKQEGWQIAWRNVMGENAVLRTDEKWDNVVKHLGYQSVSVSWNVRDALSRAIPTDRAIKDASQERLRETEVVSDEKLDSRQLAHLKLARAIAKEVFPYGPPAGVYAAIIPPASDRVRTSGMYGTTTQCVYIALDQLYRGRTMMDALVHELGHHREYRQTGSAEDLSKAHAEAMTDVAAKVVEEVAKGTFAALLKETTW